MTTTAELAAFVADVSYEDFSEETREELKKRVLDSVGIGVDALGHAPVETVHETVHETVQVANPGGAATRRRRSAQRCTIPR